MSDDTSARKLTPSMLELINKQLVQKQARAINKGLTRLKSVAETPDRQNTNADKTGQFVTVPAGEIFNNEIETAYKEAAQACTPTHITITTTSEESKKKPWFKWAK